MGLMRGRALPFVVVFLCLSLVPVLAGPNRKQAEAIYLKIAQLADPDPHVRSEAAEDLGQFPFHEVKEGLLNAIQQEMYSGQPNSFVIGAAIKSVTSMVSKDDLPFFVVLADAFDKSHEKWAQKMLNRVGKILDSNPGDKPLPHLPKLEGKEGESFFEVVDRLFKAGDLDRDTAGALRVGTEKDISHEMAEMAADPRNPTIVGREEVADQALRVWVRMKGRIPVLIGTAGVGKTAVAQQISLMIHRQNFPKWYMYQKEFPKGMILVQTSAARIGRLALSNADSAQAAALELYLDAIKMVQKTIQVPVGIFIDEFHTLTTGQCNALKPYAEEVDGIRVLGATTPREFELLVGRDAAMRRRLESVPVRELTVEETVEVLQKGWIKQIEARYRVKIPAEGLTELVKMSEEIVPDRARPDAPIKFIQDLAIYVSRRENPGEGESISISEQMARNYATHITGIPVNPREPQKLLKYIEEGRTQIKARVIGQDHVVDLLTDTWMDVLTSKAQRAWRSVAVIGTTGTGKSLSAQKLGEVFLKSREQTLTVDCTAYQAGGHGLNSLLGAPNGIISSDETKGVLPEWLAGPGKQAGVIIFNEFDKAHPDLGKRLMEMIDRGELTAGDGNVYRLARHIVVFTTNRGADSIFDRQLGHLLSSKELYQRVKKISDTQARGFFTQSEGYALLDENRLPPEVVNRIDRWVVAKPITYEDALEIAGLAVGRVQEENEELHHMRIHVDNSLVETVTRVAFTPSDGARPVEKKMETILNRARTLAWRTLEEVTGAEIRVVAEKRQDGNSYVLVYPGKKEKALGEFLFEEPAKFMAIRDPRFQATLRDLKKNILAEIFGQDEAVSAVEQAVRARVNRPLDPAPLSIWLLGSTGTGKTEMAKALAKQLYGSADRAQVIPFGRVNHRFELNNIFAPPRGVIGSESKARFETILEAFPEGTVIVFDEISNMGKALPPGEKESLFQSLYEIFGEGKWTNPHGKVYNLANYTFILTGNDGERIFEKLPNVEMRQSTWKRYRTRDKLREVLRESHIPEAFINRMDGLVLMQPLSQDVRSQIVQKFLNRIIPQLEEAHQVKIVVSQRFCAQVSLGFFPLADGARGAERFVKTEFSAFLGNFLIDHMTEVQAMGGKAQLKVDMELDLPKRYWAVAKKMDPKAVIKLESNISDGGKGTLSSAKELELTSPPRQILINQAQSTAAHEAGHALLNEHLMNPNGTLTHVTIISAGHFGGYAEYDGELTEDPTLAWFIRRIAVSAAGMVGQKVLGIADRDAGWQQDRKVINKMAYTAIVELGLVDGFEFMPPGKDDMPDLSKLGGKMREDVMEVTRLIVRAGIEVAEVVLSNERIKGQLEGVAKALLDQGSLTGEAFLKQIGDHRLSERSFQQLMVRLQTALGEKTKQLKSVSCQDRIIAEGLEGE